MITNEVRDQIMAAAFAVLEKSNDSSNEESSDVHATSVNLPNLFHVNYSVSSSTAYYYPSGITSQQVLNAFWVDNFEDLLKFPQFSPDSTGNRDFCRWLVNGIKDSRLKLYDLEKFHAATIGKIASVGLSKYKKSLKEVYFERINANDFHCHPCDTKFNGICPYVIHLVQYEHARLHLNDEELQLLCKLADAIAQEQDNVNERKYNDIMRQQELRNAKP